MAANQTEKHIQTILISIVTATILATAAFTFNTNADIQVIKEQITNMNVTLAELKTSIEGEKRINREKIEDLAKTVNSNYIKTVENQRDLIMLEARILPLETKRGK